MPRIDPLKLLTCLDVLLSSTGGIQSTQEVKRLASLMTKYSKKLVSKCIYIQILKCTETELLGQFMEAGGWSLTHLWLKDAIFSNNWPLIQELLELLLLCPVDVERLKVNSAPKLVKSLSKDSTDEGVRLLASKLVEQWLRIVKGETMTSVDIQPVMVHQTIVNSGAQQEEYATENVPNTNGYDEEGDNLAETEDDVDNGISRDKINNNLSENIVETTISRKHVTNNNSNSNLKNKITDPLVYKITVKDGKQILAKIDTSSHKKIKPVGDEVNNVNNSSDIEISSKSDVKNKDVEKKNSSSSSSSSKDKEKSSSSDKDRDRKSSSSSSSHRSSSSSSKSKSSSSSSSHRSSSSSSKSSSSRSGKSSSSSSNSSRDKSKSSSSKSSSSSSSSRDKDKIKKDQEKEVDKTSQAEKDKETLSKMILPSINKLGKIPKKVPKEGEEVSSNGTETSTSTTTPTSTTISSKKASISIEVRNSENRIKTVKTYNSQFRSHGLAEEAPPPPPRKGLKKPTTNLLPSAVPAVSATTNILSASLKRASPPPSSIDYAGAPPEKKLKDDLLSVDKLEKLEKPGSVKLITPKPKHVEILFPINDKHNHLEQHSASLIESNMFMDEISKYLPKSSNKKKKRRISTSKDGSGAESPVTPGTPTSPTKVIAAPLKFYQDTLEDDDNKTADEEKVKKEDGDSDEDSDEIKPTKKLKSEINDDDDDTDLLNDVDIDINIKIEENIANEIEEAVNEKKPPGPGCGPDGPPGVLTIYRRKGPKKQLKWRPQETLEEIRFFELDELERVNVTKTFGDQRQAERSEEKKTFLMGRKLPQEDLMKEATEWMPLILIENIPPHPDGSSSKERQIQNDRETAVLKALYFSNSMIPESPLEPDMEPVPQTDPQFIPLYDITGADTINSFINMNWPEPKGSPIHATAGYNSFFPTSQLAPANGYSSQPYVPPNNWLNGVNPNFSGNPEALAAGLGLGSAFNNSMITSIHSPDQMKANISNLVGINNNFAGPTNMNNNYNTSNRDNLNINLNNNSNNNNNYGRNRGGGNNNNNRAPPNNGGWYRSGGGPSNQNWNNNNNNNNNNNSNNNRGYGGSNWTQNRGICKQFKNTRFCKNGDKCNYIH